MSNPTDSPVDNSQDDIVVAVMGATGSGKSSFINLLTGRDSVKVGHDLESQTMDVEPISFLAKDIGQKVTIVDSPGFDDSRYESDGMTDTDILKKIAEYLVKEYNDQRKLNGLIFVIRISDIRFSAQSTRNLRMFRNLCGTQAFQNVVILTTFWDKVTLDEGQDREKQLLTQYFADLVAGGATFIRNDRNKRTVTNVLRHILKLPPVVTQIQEEMCEQKKKLEETTVGSVHLQEIEALVSKHQKEVADLKAEIRMIKESRSAERQGLERELKEFQDKLAIWDREKEKLEQGLESERIYRQTLERRFRQMTLTPQERSEKAREAHEHALVEKDDRTFMKKGLELGKELPFVPDVIGKPVAGGVGLIIDVANAVRHGSIKRSKRR